MAGQAERSNFLEAVRGYGFGLQHAPDHLRGDRDVVLAAIAQDAAELRLASEELRGDREFVLAAVARNRRAFEFASEELRGDREVVLAAVAQDAAELRFASEEMKGDRDVVLAAVARDGLALQYASKELKGDREVVLVAVAHAGPALKYASKELQGDHEIVLKAVSKDGRALYFASVEMQGSREIVLAAVKQRGPALDFASEELKKDREILLTAVAQEGQMILDAPDDLKADREYVLAAVTQNGRMLQHASSDLKEDREVVLVAAIQDDRALHWTSSELRGDRELILAAAAQNGLVLLHASQELKGDREIVLAAVAQNGRAFCYASEELRGDHEVALTAVAQHGEALGFASEELKGDREFVLDAVAQNAEAFQYASEELKGDREFVLEAVARNGGALQYASEELKEDREIVLAAVSQNGRALACASEELKGDREVVLAAVARNGAALQYASEELKGDREIVLAAVSQNGRALEYVTEGLRQDSVFTRLAEWAISGRPDERGDVLTRSFEIMLRSPSWRTDVPGILRWCRSFVDPNVIIYRGNTLLHIATAVGDLETLDVLLQRGGDLHQTNDDRNSLLHVAVLTHVDVVRYLVDAGLSVRLRNRSRQTPLGRLRNSGNEGNPQIDSFLEDVRTRLSLLFGGDGQAKSRACTDQRPIARVRWYTIPSPGWGGALGVVHSIVRVDVEDGRDRRSYAIEKAETRVGRQGIVNGVFVSDWRTVEENCVELEFTNFRELRGEHLRAASLQMATLIDVAESLGPYDLYQSNCDHVAMEVYNACAVEAQHLNSFQLPNALFMALCWLPRCLLRPMDSSSISVNSRHSLRSLLKHGFALTSDAGRLTLEEARLATDAAYLSQWIYRPSRESTDQHGHSFYERAIRNDLNQTVEVFVEQYHYFSDPSSYRFRLEPGALGTLKFPANRSPSDITIRVNYLNIFGGTDRLTRCMRETIQCDGAGDRQAFVLEYDDEESRERLSRQPQLPDEMQIRYTSNPNGTDSVVQWSIARPLTVGNKSIVYVTFRGTASKLDAMIDAAYAPGNVQAFHDLRIPSGMWDALNQTDSVLRRLDQLVEDMRRELISGERMLVLCGHSLGGGYAVLASLHLLSRFPDLLKSETFRVLTYGAPQVIAKLIDHVDLWDALDAATIQFINAYDPVPRLPSRLDWIQWLSETLVGFGTVTVGLCRKVISKGSQDTAILEQYHTIGTQAFIAKESDLCELHASGTDEAMNLLDRRSESPLTGPESTAYHATAMYVQILRGVSYRMENGSSAFQPNMALRNSGSYPCIALEPDEW
eukprot:scaffold1196_cov151-Pinguiococcus_pyrenoidosus.AAC.7